MVVLENGKRQVTPRGSWQFNIWQLLFGTIAASMLFAMLKVFPGLLYFFLIIAVAYMAFGPFIITFVAIVFGPTKNNSISLNYGPIKVLFVLWFLSVLTVIVFATLVSAGLIY